MPWLRVLLDAAALALAALTALAVDLGGARQARRPPGFAQPWRRALATAVLALLFYLAIFQPLAALGESDPTDLVGQPIPLLFVGHGVMLAAVAAWAALGFGGAGGGGAAGRAGRELGCVAARPWAEVGLGLLGGAAAWGGMVAVVLGIGSLLVALGGEHLLPRQAPEAVAWLAGLPVGVRVALSLSAGAVEELLFRGLLQPRLGVGLSTLLFLLAHGSYGQPFMLVGLTWVSLVLAALARRRGSVVPAMVAHAVFDLVQLLVVIPWLLRGVPVLGA
jgi:membrane protease YdiL (CAAX protease family)